jgi:hypothetical protein
MSFKKFYEETKLVEESLALLTEDEIDDILRFIDVEREGRSKDIKKTKNHIQGKKTGIDFIKFFVKDPKGSGEEQKGYISHRGTDIRKMFCSCEDFYYRVYWNLLKDNMAAKKFLPPAYRFILKRKYGDKTPPKGEEGLRMCKHLIAVSRKYVK